ncbi:hypothetical protein SO3561_08940 [Streptomyces olivochromogenes]|uniref:Uncharacterized protein n=2 Tax=Streptomyces olivochromogenes TaxID=1963 RepID=A0A250VTR9_STROL|nr:hypothetical protein SO3561_08940 [Streptomyces olivochromogenes]
MIGVDAGSGDRLTLAVLTQYRMAATEQMTADQELQCGPHCRCRSDSWLRPLPHLRGKASPDGS